MKKTNNFTLGFSTIGILMIFGLFNIFHSCNSSSVDVKPEMVVEAETEPEVEISSDIIWHIKAIHSDGKFIDVKAFDQIGNMFDFKAIQDSDQRQLLDVKAFVGEEKFPVKILVSEDVYNPIKAIGPNGAVYDIKALTDAGEKLDVKGISRSGNIINIKAIDKAGALYGIKAISSEGQLNDVKGVKMAAENIETVLNGTEVYAHIKAIPQAACAGENGIWHIKAVHPEGRFLDIKAVGKDGNLYDVKAIQDANQRQLMDIRAFVGEEKVPVKILMSEDKYSPIKGIGADGTIYEIKAITPEGNKLDVKGVSRSGNIINIKAISEDGAFYSIKAISKEGQLNDVKGVKMSDEDLELMLNGAEVHAHIKALPQIN
ncbi:hypothetical protein N8987_04725 [Crocinitomix sp.]|nr:hypothetical protein [Crocinitomix sp.]